MLGKKKETVGIKHIPRYEFCIVFVSYKRLKLRVVFSCPFVSVQNFL